MRDYCAFAIHNQCSFFNFFLCGGYVVSKVLSGEGVKALVRGGKTVERQVFRCSTLCFSVSCYGWVFLVAFHCSRRRGVLGKDRKRMGDNHSSYNHSLRGSSCNRMDWLGFGFHSAAPPGYHGTFRGLRRAASYFFSLLIRKIAKTAAITNTIRAMKTTGSIPNIWACHMFVFSAFVVKVKSV